MTTHYGFPQHTESVIDAKALRLLEQALELPQAERKAFVRRSSLGDAVLEERVTHLLEFTNESRDPSPQVSLFPQLKDFLEVGHFHSLDSCKIGPYKILRPLARGGMGHVYLASQEHPKRRVALKVLRFLDSQVLRTRFEREANFLASLAHPNIASVFDAGVHEVRCSDGALWHIPYLVMEHVRGARSILRHCQEQLLSCGMRTRLFLSVCDAVQHGHDNGVLHRDLKPDNILVGSDGVPKLIDFGVAKALGLPETDSVTEPGTVLGTRRYISPEQFEGGTRPDVRSDVFSLGVVLGELLSDSVTSTHNLRSRELLWIVTKATDTDPEYRYTSVHNLASDLRRFLNHQPVQAGRATTRYHVRKFVRRHRLTLSVASISFLIASTALVSREMATNRLREKAKEDLRSASLVLDQITSLAHSSGTREERVALLENSSASLDWIRNQDLKDTQVEDAHASVLDRLGNAALEVGQTGTAWIAFTEAERIRRRLATRQSPETMANLSIALVKLGDARKAEMHLSEAQSYYEQALTLDKDLHERFPENIHYLDNLTWSFERLGHLTHVAGQLAAARRWYEKRHHATEQLYKAAPTRSSSILGMHESHSRLATLAYEEGDSASFRDHVRESIPYINRLYEQSPENRHLREKWLGAHSRRARVEAQLGHVETAEKLLLEVIHGYEQLAAAEPDNIQHNIGVAAAARCLGDLYVGVHDPSSAAIWYERTAQVKDRLLSLGVRDREHRSSIALNLQRLAQSLAGAGNIAGSREPALRALEIAEELAATSPPRHQDLDLLSHLLLDTPLEGFRDPPRSLSIARATFVSCPKNWRAHAALSKALLANGFWEDAAHHANMALSQLPDPSDHRYTRLTALSEEARRAGL